VRRRSADLALAACLASSGCALNFDQFVDGSPAAMDVVARPFEAGADANPSSGCRYPWLFVGVAGPSSSTLLRYTITSTSTSRCTDFVGMPHDLDLFTAIDSLRYAVVNADGTWIVDATRPDAALEIGHLADTTPTAVFTIYHATVPYVVVPYRNSTGGSSIRVVRIIDVSHTPYVPTDWTPSAGTNGPSLSDPMVAMTLDPGAAGRVVAVPLSNSTTARSVDVFDGTIDVFRMATGGFVNGAHGIWGVGVGFALGSNDAPAFSVTDATRATSMSSADGPHSCTGECPFATRLEVVPDPISPAAGAFVFCRQPTGLARVLRWSASSDRCEVVTDLNDSNASHEQYMSIELVAAATRN
jgi:hypothetical protein